MTRLARWIRNIWQRWRDRYYEGPEAPDRLRQGAMSFAALNPHANVAEWIAYSEAAQAEAYRSGYVRGLEWTERDLDRRDPVVDPELLLDQRRHDWSWVDLAPSPEQLKEVVKENQYEHLSPEDRALALDSVGRYFGGYRVEMLEVDDSKKR